MFELIHRLRKCIGAAGLALVVAAGSAGGACAADTVAEAELAALLAREGRVLWAPGAEGDSGWEKQWFLDGEVGRVVPLARGFELHAGPTPGAPADHVVLWSHPEFTGDLRLDFTYTRLDDARRDVNILYLFARGSGEPPHVEDLFAWRELRRVPRMGLYFNHLDTYHISFAAFGDRASPETDYIRLRRYRPDAGNYLAGTDLAPDYFDTGLFAPGVPHRMTVVRQGQRLFLRVEVSGRVVVFHWDLSPQPPLTQGRIGLRHMAGRSARYEDVVVRELPQ